MMHHKKKASMEINESVSGAGYRYCSRNAQDQTVNDEDEDKP